MNSHLGSVVEENQHSLNYRLAMTIPMEPTQMEAGLKKKIHWRQIFTIRCPCQKIEDFECIKKNFTSSIQCNLNWGNHI